MYYLHSSFTMITSFKNNAGPQNKLIYHLMTCQIMNGSSRYDNNNIESGWLLCSKDDLSWMIMNDRLISYLIRNFRNIKVIASFFFFLISEILSKLKFFLWNSSILTKFYFYLSKIGSHKSALVKRIVGNTLRKRQHFCSWKDLDVVRWGRKFLWFFLKKGSMFSSIDLYIENVVF